MKRLYFIAYLSLLIACAGPKQVSTSPSPASLVADGKLWSSLFQQKAAEYKALCIQAYNIARFRLDDALRQPSEKSKAIVSDIDETFLITALTLFTRHCREKIMTEHHGRNGHPKE